MTLRVHEKVTTANLHTQTNIMPSHSKPLKLTPPLPTFTTSSHTIAPTSLIPNNLSNAFSSSTI